MTPRRPRKTQRTKNGTREVHSDENDQRILMFSSAILITTFVKSMDDTTPWPKPSRGACHHRRQKQQKNDRQRSALLLLCFNDESALFLDPYRQLVPVTSPHLAGGGPGGGSSVFGGWQRGHWVYM